MNRLLKADTWHSFRSCQAATRKVENLKETERNIKEAIGVYLESLAAHGVAIGVEGPSFQGRVTVPA